MNEKGIFVQLGRTHHRYKKYEANHTKIVLGGLLWYRVNDNSSNLMLPRDVAEQLYKRLGKLLKDE